MEIFAAVVVVAVLGLLISVSSGDMGAVFMFVLVLFAGIVVLSWVLSFMARRQQSWLVNATPAAIGEAVQACFAGVGWKQVGGPGQLNFQARGFGIGAFNAKRPVMSIDIEDHSDGNCGVGVWTSSWSTQAGVLGLCDRVVSKRFWLRRRLTELSPTGSLPGATALPAGSSAAAATPAGEDRRAVLADPGLPDAHPRQVAYELLKAVGLAFVVYGPGEPGACFSAVSQLCPELGTTVGHNGSEFLGTLSNRDGLFVLCFQGPYGSALALCVAGADTNWVTDNIAMKLRELPHPWQWGICAGGGSVPAGFAQAVDPASVVELHRIPQLAHNNPPPATYQPQTFPTASPGAPQFASPQAAAFSPESLLSAPTASPTTLSPQSFLSTPTSNTPTTQFPAVNPTSAATAQFPAVSGLTPPETCSDPQTTALSTPSPGALPPPTEPAAPFPPPSGHAAQLAPPPPPAGPTVNYPPPTHTPPPSSAYTNNPTPPAPPASVNSRTIIVAGAAVIVAVIAALAIVKTGNHHSSDRYTNDTAIGINTNISSATAPSNNTSQDGSIDPHGIWTGVIDSEHGNIRLEITSHNRLDGRITFMYPKGSCVESWTETSSEGSAVIVAEKFLNGSLECFNAEYRVQLSVDTMQANTRWTSTGDSFSMTLRKEAS